MASREGAEPVPLMKQLLAGGGLMTFFLVYGVLQERIMTIPWGEAEEMFSSSAFLVLNNRVVAIMMSLTILLYTKQTLAPAAPLNKYFGIAISNTGATFCQYEALKYVSFPTQTLGKCAKMFPILIISYVLKLRSYTARDYVIFRDQELSDRIGFLYQHLPGAQAADDLIYRLLEIYRRLGNGQAPYLVSIILDGENCWEHYEHNGDVFLDALYAGLGRRPELKTVTISEYLTDRRPATTLAKLSTGSWIGGDLTTWIGDPEHNRAWDALRRAREHLVAHSVSRSQIQKKGQRLEIAPEGPAAGRPPTRTEASTQVDTRLKASEMRLESPALTRAWRALYAAEGSDWFWWYSHRNTSDQDELFDRLFRHNLAAAYEALGDEAPAWLAEPINRPPAGPGGRPASSYVTPQLTGAPYPGEAWAAAAVIQPAELSTGTMQRAETVFERLFLGHNPQALYLRLDLRRKLDEFQVDIYLSGRAGTPHNQRPRGRHPDPTRAPKQFAAAWLLSRQPGQPAPFLYRADGQEGWVSVSPATAALAERAMEVCVPLQTLGLALDDDLRVQVALIRDGQVIAQLPEGQMAALKLTSFPSSSHKGL